MRDAISHPTPQMNVRRTGRIRVWNPLVRVFHWSLVAAFATAWLTADEAQPVHEIAGYTVAGLVAFRLVWGFVGGRYARFAQFVKGPGETLAYIGDVARGRERRHIGHNPAGALMVVAILATLAGTAVTGWLMEDEPRAAMLPLLPAVVAPAMADDDGDEGERAEQGENGERGEAEGPLKEVHETLANLMLLLVALHLAGVALASVRHHENLVRAMLTGDKRAPATADIA